MHWMNGWMNGYGGGFMGGMWLFWLLLLVVLVLAVRWAVSGFGPREGGRRGTPADSALESPEDVLKKRYARGEISKTEFEVKLRDLQGHGTPHPTPSRP
jgi:putative membrane protein